MDTVAPTTAAWLVSVTVPWILPRNSCANELAASKADSGRRIRLLFTLMELSPQCSRLGGSSVAPEPHPNLWMDLRVSGIISLHAIDRICETCERLHRTRRPGTWGGLCCCRWRP